MKAFFVRWRSARQYREYELFADQTVGACLLAALEAAGGREVWQAGTVWKCPGCGDRTLRTEEFVEGLRRAEDYLRREEEWRRLSGEPADPAREATLAWLEEIAAQMLGCERERVYIQEEGGDCTFGNERYTSRI